MFCRKCGYTLSDGICQKCGSSTALKSCHSDLEQILYPVVKRYRVIWMVQKYVWEEQQLSPGSAIVPHRQTPNLVGQNSRFLRWGHVPSVMPEHDLRIYAEVSNVVKKKWYHSCKFWYAALFFAGLACILSIACWPSIP